MEQHELITIKVIAHKLFALDCLCFASSGKVLLEKKYRQVSLQTQLGHNLQRSLKKAIILKLAAAASLCPG